MGSMWLLYLFLAICLSFLSASAKEVIEVTSDTYRTHVSYNSGYILFYAPWCGHCKKVKPLWDELANDPDVEYEVSQVDCTADENSKIVFNNKIKGYPTIKFHHDGNLYTYPYKRRIGPLKTFAENILSGNPEVEAEKIMGGTLGFSEFLDGLQKVSPFFAISSVTLGAGLGILAVLAFYCCCVSSEAEFEEMLEKRKEEILEMRREREEKESKGLEKKGQNKEVTNDDKPEETKKDR
uniref:Thioredoxin domain-containing protein n=1 Tax=Aplanochytrium stocchinoi TaxID=215587 RepID=A0A6S8BG15_9STRA|mmetsp:Transcript_2673/g.3389  ORF Transcript_2673/g.3389 Transcript_2673/m.3389 type:complete len:238 (+) Transcript_2673:83-796(+)|eukprot:CAMPEP_0204823130 /NCGR_PEP_ID=MMETSP1346-20131115/1252_1 /ASSEMBLY_ACC=CAM_ASM_000771 /TAXON_ID=215587 /ORGANISM="Aplanochytrium stocchinoi, Strain GSBS06" /LENGTH=237 /DNA_ID=CAMNT_0051949667 /DNA_START=15 /DNA_END=728 /DNA_ORIENTATION=+